jgi:phage gp46-like protein
LDIQLGFIQPSQTEVGYFDLLMDGSDLASGSELETAVIISLFTNRRAEDDDPLPDAFADRQGFWGDDFADIEGDLIGSRWWLLAAEKQTNEVRLKYLEYAVEALQWLIDDSVASEVQIQAEYIGPHVLGVSVVILHGNNVSDRFEFVWDQLRNQILKSAEPIAFQSGQVYLLTEDGNFLTTEDGLRLLI